MGWLQALNRIVCTGQRSSGSILFLAFPQELILKLAERTGGKPVRVHIPRLHDGLVRTDSSGRTFLVDSLKGGGEKHTFLFKYADGKILLDDLKAEPTRASRELDAGDLAADSDLSASMPDDAVEFNPAAFSDAETSDAPRVM